MIDFKYKGYEVKIGGIAKTTRVEASNGMDSCVWLFRIPNNTKVKKAKWHRFIKKIQQAITERINYMRKEEV